MFRKMVIFYSQPITDYYCMQWNNGNLQAKPNKLEQDALSSELTDSINPLVEIGHGHKDWRAVVPV